MLAKLSFLFQSFFLQHHDFNMVVIWGPTNFLLFSLASENFGNIALISWNVSPLKSKAFTNCFNEPNFMWRGVIKFFPSLQVTAWWHRTFLALVRPLEANGSSRSALYQFCCSTSKENTSIGVTTMQTQQKSQHLKITTNVPIEFSIVCFMQ